MTNPNSYPKEGSTNPERVAFYEKQEAQAFALMLKVSRLHLEGKATYSTVTRAMQAHSNSMIEIRNERPSA